MTIGMDILNALWNTTEESTWNSLLYNLDEIHGKEIITTAQWQRLHYAITKVNENGSNFPDSIGELYQLLDPYM